MTTRDDEVLAGTFAHGFLASTKPLRSAHVRTWPRARLGRLSLALHPATAFTEHTLRTDGPAGVLLGQAVDLERPSVRPGVILRRALRALERGGLDAALRYTADLGGRWAMAVAHRGTIHVVNDSHAAQSVYWAEKDGRVVLASHDTLCADEAGADVDEESVAAFRRVREVRPKGTTFLPGIKTPFLGVRPVIASCRLVIPASGSPRHLRYAPLAPLRQAPARSEEVYARFEQQLERHVRLLTAFGRTGISLTGGGDSAVTLAALRRVAPKGLFAYTYINPPDLARRREVAEDVFTASRRAHEAGIPYRLIQWRNPEEGEVFDEILTRMWPVLRPSVGAAHAMYRDLPHDFVELQSTVAETGTVFFRNRTSDVLDARRLTVLWGGKRAPERPEYVEAFEEYIDYTQFREDALLGYDYHDLFYWEHRNSRWLAEKYQVGDIGHRVLLPFNARPIVETMLSLPMKDRDDKWLLTEYRARRGAAPVARGRQVRPTRPRTTRSARG